ncbi:MAG: substrate-binding domain-containing protein [Oscillospiraceae bacterium]
MIKRLAALALSLALGCAVLCGCNGSEAPDTRETPVFTAANETVQGRKNIYLIVKNVDSSYWQVIMQAVADSGTDHDCNIFSSGTHSEMDWDIQERLIDDAVAAGADMIIFAPNDSVKLSKKVSEVYNSGIPIVLVDTVVNTEDYNICYMTDNLSAGQYAAREMIERFREAGIREDEAASVAIQVGSFHSQTISERLAGFCQYWIKNAPESWKIIDEVKSNDGSVDRAVTCAEEFLDRYEDIRGVFGCNNGSTVGFARTIKARGRTDIAIVGFDYSDEMRELIADDRYNAATMLQKQYYMGYKAVETALAIGNGEEMTVKFVDTGIAVVNRHTVDDAEVIEILSHN